MTLTTMKLTCYQHDAIRIQAQLLYALICPTLFRSIGSGLSNDILTANRFATIIAFNDSRRQTGRESDGRIIKQARDSPHEHSYSHHSHGVLCVVGTEKI